MTKSRIAPRLWRPLGGGGRESILKPCFRRDALFRADKPAIPCRCGGVFCLHSLMHFKGGTPKNCLSLGIRAPAWQRFLEPNRVHDPKGISIGYDTRCYFNVRSKADTSQLNLPHGSASRHTDHATSVARGRTCRSTVCMRCGQ